MELRKGAEAAVKDTVAIGKFIGERLVGGAFAALADIVLQPQPNENHIERGQE